MKNTLVKLCMSAILMALIINCAKKIKTDSGGKIVSLFNIVTDILGESSTDGSVNKGAIAYSLGSNGGYVLKDEKVFL
jgi:hypothetical protein